MTEFKCKAFWRAVLAEFVGMTLFIYLSISSAIGNKNNSSPDQEVKVSLAFGLAIATLAQSLGHISGAHLNPAVTLGMLTSCQISFFKAVMYIVAQTLGSSLASGIVYGARPNGTDTLGLNVVSEIFHIVVVDRNLKMWEEKNGKSSLMYNGHELDETVKCTSQMTGNSLCSFEVIDIRVGTDSVIL